MIAVERKFVDIVEFLLSMGADVSLVANNGNRFFDLSTGAEIINLLKKHLIWIMGLKYIKSHHFLGFRIHFITNSLLRIKLSKSP